MPQNIGRQEENLELKIYNSLWEATESDHWRMLREHVLIFIGQVYFLSKSFHSWGESFVTIPLLSFYRRAVRDSELWKSQLDSVLIKAEFQCKVLSPNLLSPPGGKLKGLTAISSSVVLKEAHETASGTGLLLWQPKTEWLLCPLSYGPEDCPQCCGFLGS